MCKPVLPVAGVDMLNIADCVNLSYLLAGVDVLNIADCVNLSYLLQVSMC